ncbi:MULTISPECIES: hypothetical protein [unclassified Sulfitobacter]|uniref:hypothetical protein n=1 Tax=unclassified Sulfitobacter TaxID=196795 RepID=UPI003745190D
MRNIFLSYGTPKFYKARDELCKSALAVGFDKALGRGPDDLDIAFTKANAELLSRPRGGGYWVWKPRIILQELRKLEPGDVLVYCDAGRYNYYNLNLFPKALIARARKDGMVLNVSMPRHGALSKWTKRDCLVLLNMDRPEVISKPQIQACWSFWTPSEEAFDFLSTWVQHCSDPRIVSDQPNELGLPNYPDFIDHRHDQSIFTLLIYKYNMPYLDYTDRGLDRILRLRTKSMLSQRFLARLDDAERMEGGSMIAALSKAFFDLRSSR